MEVRRPTSPSQPGAAAALPPAIIFGGNDNALSIARSLGAAGIPVYALNQPNADIFHSRYVRPLGPSEAYPDGTREFLLGPDSDHLAGAVLLAASDEALEVIARDRAVLQDKFRLDLSNRVAQQAMLDKLTTYQMAAEAGVPTPRFWNLEASADVESLRDELVYPLIVKPKLSHLFQRRFDAKFLVAKDWPTLRDALASVDEAGLEVLLVEFIPGPDSLLCSYYTYLDEDGRPLFDFTKRIIRRHPTNMGLACYHITDHVPGVGELSRQLFQHVGLRGLANAEFKMDERDGTLKLIECNARFTAANGLVRRAGLDLSLFVYRRLVGVEQPPLGDFRDGLRLWDPARDFRAFRELRARGELSFVPWVRSVLHVQSFPAFCWADPVPSLMRLRKRLGKRGKS